MADSDLLKAVLGASGAVSTKTDDTFQKAREMEPKQFGDLVTGRAESHKGFSAPLLFPSTNEK